MLSINLPFVLVAALLLALCNVAIYIILDKNGAIQWLQFRVKEIIIPTRCLFCFFYRLAFLEFIILLLCSEFSWWKLLEFMFAGPAMSAVLSLKFLPEIKEGANG